MNVHNSEPNCIQKEANKIIEFICAFSSNHKDIRKEYGNDIILGFVGLLTIENNEIYTNLMINDSNSQNMFQMIQTLINEDRESHAFFLSIMRDDKKIKLFNNRTKIAVPTPCKGPIYFGY